MKCDIGIRDGRVVALAEHLEEGEVEIDASGKLVLPGGVDSHCHIEQESSGGVMTADDFYSGTVSAAFGGTTCIIPFAAQMKGQTLREVVEKYHDRAGPKAVIDYGFHLIIADPTPEVMRAVSVPINATTGISGFIFPGDFVDLLLTQSIERGEVKRRASETVLREVRVLAVDQRVSDQEGEPAVAKTATLEVTPKQAETIAVVMEIGRLSLALRSLQSETEDGETVIEPKGPTLTWDSQVSKVLQPVRAPDGKPATTQVKVVRGSESQTLAFRRTNQ